MLVSWSFIQKGMSVSYIKSLQFVIISFTNTGLVTAVQNLFALGRPRVAPVYNRLAKQPCADRLCENLIVQIQI